MTDLLEHLGTAAGAAGPRADVKGPKRSRRRVQWLVWGITAFGLALRLRGLTTGGLWTSDAWVALSSRVGIGTAWHMWANAPGFDLLERTWLLLNPHATWWGQLPALGLGVASIPSVYFLTRYFGFRTWVSTAAALVVSVSPVCIAYSTRYKEYSADFLLACALLFLAEKARRDPSGRRYGHLAAVSILGFTVSASTIPVIAAVWLATLLWGGRRLLRQWLPPAAVVAASCATLRAVLYRHLSPHLHEYWSANFFRYGSPRVLVNSISSLTVSVYGGLTGGHSGTMTGYLATFGLGTALLVLGAARQRPLLAPTLALGAALALCAAGVIPLGTGRTDEVLYPELILLFGSGLQQLSHWVKARCRDSVWVRSASHGVAIIAVLSLVLGGAGVDNRYNSVDVGALAHRVEQQLRPGDHVVVDAFLRYDWALSVEAQPRIVLGSAWMSGFSVLSTQPDVFVVPSFAAEGGVQDRAWARNLTRYRRIWYLQTTLQRPSALLLKLRGDGWRTGGEIRATGCMALLLQRAA